MRIDSERAECTLRAHYVSAGGMRNDGNAQWWECAIPSTSPVKVIKSIKSKHQKTIPSRKQSYTTLAICFSLPHSLTPTPQFSPACALSLALSVFPWQLRRFILVYEQAPVRAEIKPLCGSKISKRHIIDIDEIAFWTLKVDEDCCLSKCTENNFSQWPDA